MPEYDTPRHAICRDQRCYLQIYHTGPCDYFFDESVPIPRAPVPTEAKSALADYALSASKHPEWTLTAPTEAGSAERPHRVGDLGWDAACLHDAIDLLTDCVEPDGSVALDVEESNALLRELARLRDAAKEK